MSTWNVTCPRCESTELKPCDEVQEGGGEKVETTHECVKCGQRFRYEPPIPGFTGTEVVV